MNHKEVKDTGFIVINDKPYKVNQSSPSMELIKTSSEIVVLYKNYNNDNKIIERIQHKLDDILLAEDDDLDRMLEEYRKYEEILNEKIKDIDNILNSIGKMFKDTIIFYLGEEAYEKDLKHLGFMELTDIVTKCKEENIYTKEV